MGIYSTAFDAIQPWTGLLTSEEYWNMIKRNGATDEKSLHKLITEAYPKQVVLLGNELRKFAPPGLYELCFAARPIHVVKAAAEIFFWVDHPTLGFMAPLDPQFLFGPYRQLKVFADGAQYESQD